MAALPPQGTNSWCYEHHSPTPPPCLELFEKCNNLKRVQASCYTSPCMGACESLRLAVHARTPTTSNPTGKMMPTRCLSLLEGVVAIFPTQNNISVITKSKNNKKIKGLSGGEVCHRGRSKKMWLWHSSEISMGGRCLLLPSTAAAATRWLYGGPRICMRAVAGGGYRLSNHEKLHRSTLSFTSDIPSLPTSRIISR